jgi:hypothetical protein
MCGVLIIYCFLSFCRWFVLCLVYVPFLEPGTVSGDSDWLYPLGQTELVLPEDGDRIQYPKRCFLKNKQGDF